MILLTPHYSCYSLVSDNMLALHSETRNKRVLKEIIHLHGIGKFYDSKISPMLRSISPDHIFCCSQFRSEVASRMTLVFALGVTDKLGINAVSLSPDPQ